ncbi:MAG: iron chelate uptake ABC transporter family permease subunit [Lactobacillales bacterium]|jgi:iron complex transport system permease protein|nr:iron chelate uptake ABC transporter family permease subunit [Lactobacillales bacterium]
MKLGMKKFLLVVAIILACALYLTYHTYGNFAFAWEIRGKRLIAFLLVGIATSFSTISFQTLTQNRLLTPNILGLDSLYVLVQTMLVFFLGGDRVLGNESIGQFLGNILLMVGGSVLLAHFFLRKSHNNLFLLLMIGMILGTFFHNISSFLQVVMDPNEFSLLQGKLFASFGNVNSKYLGIAALLIFVMCGFLWYLSPTLDVLHLGNHQAINLGVKLDTIQFLVLLAVSTLVGVATALVGPTTFLGFIVANSCYQFMQTFRHKELFFGGSLLAILLLVLGQFLVEHVFKLNTTLSVVIEFAGGCYFVGRLLKERSSAN